MQEREYSLAHVQALLDVVLGVVVALPLGGVAMLLRAYYASPSLKSFGEIAVLVAALLFPTLYWFETRYFIAAQRRFNEVIEKTTNGAWQAVKTAPPMFLLGSLLMIALAGVAIAFASVEEFGKFLAVNALFWLLELGGTLVLRSRYGGFPSAASAAGGVAGSVAAKVRETAPDVYAWVTGRFTSWFFVAYGAINLAIFAILAVVNRVYHFTEAARAILAALVLALVLFRHLVWHHRIYEWNTRRLLAKSGRGL